MWTDSHVNTEAGTCRAFAARTPNRSELFVQFCIDLAFDSASMTDHFLEGRTLCFVATEPWSSSTVASGIDMSDAVVPINRSRGGVSGTRSSPPPRTVIYGPSGPCSDSAGRSSSCGSVNSGGRKHSASDSTTNFGPGLTHCSVRVLYRDGSDSRDKPGTPRFRPDAVVADGAYTWASNASLGIRGSKPLLLERGVEDGRGLGSLRWVVERTIAWLRQFRRLRARYGTIRRSIKRSSPSAAS